TVKGRVVDPKGMPVEGVAVAGVFGEERIPLWRTTTDRDGGFEWRNVAPQAPQYCVAYANEKTSGESTVFSIEAGATQDIGSIVVPEGAGGVSLKGKNLAWRENRLLYGELQGRKSHKSNPAVIVYCDAKDATMVIEGLSAA